MSAVVHGDRTVTRLDPSPRFILAVTDFSVHGHNVLHRAAMLSAERATVLKLACFTRPGEPAPADAITRLARHASQLSQAYGIEAFAATDPARRVDDLRPDVDTAELVVWGTAPSRGWRALFRGQPWEALIRTARQPVLVVRRPATRAHRRALMLVDLSDASRAVLEAGLSFARAASVELFHAVSTAHEAKLRHAEVSARAIRAYRAQCRRQAETRIAALTQAIEPQGSPLAWTIAHGDPARRTLLQQQHTGADLIVVGKRPSSVLWDLVFGSTASRLLRLAEVTDNAADVLILPGGGRSAAAPASGAPCDVQCIPAGGRSGATRGALPVR